MSVYLMKIEGEGDKDLGNGQSVRVFESRNALVTGSSRGDSSVTTCRVRLRDEVNRAIEEKGGHVIWGGGASLEISKEQLLELAELARTRSEMAAERESFETV